MATRASLSRYYLKSSKNSIEFITPQFQHVGCNLNEMVASDWFWSEELRYYWLNDIM